MFAQYFLMGITVSIAKTVLLRTKHQPSKKGGEQVKRQIMCGHLSSEERLLGVTPKSCRFEARSVSEAARSVSEAARSVSEASSSKSRRTNATIAESASKELETHVKCVR